MAPTTEKLRKFRVLRKDGTEMAFIADTICQLNEHATYFRFKRDGNIVGEIQGEVDAWWLENGDAGKTWTIELPDSDTISFVADSSKREGSKTVFQRAGEDVAVIFVEFNTWAVS